MRKVLGVILLILAVLFAMPTILIILNAVKGLISLVNQHPTKQSIQIWEEVGAAVISIAFDIALFYYGTKFLHKKSPQNKS